MSAKTLCAATVLAGLTPVISAESHLIFIKDAKIVTVSGATMAQGSVLIRDGRIAQVGANLTPPSDARIVEARGLTLYPGLFDSSCNIGMGTAREATMGELLPHLLAFWSFRSEDEHVELSRANGVTHIVARPGRAGAGGRLRRGLVPGSAAVVDLSGETVEKSEITRQGPLAVNFPTVGPLEYTGDERFAVDPWTGVKKVYERDLAELRRFFKEARDYAARKETLSPEALVRFQPDLKLEAMIPVIQGRRVVYLQADSDVDIKAAVTFGKEQKLNFVIEGAGEAARVADFLKASEVSVILGPTQAVPSREDDATDAVYRTPKILHDRGVTFALSSSGGGGGTDTRHLGYQAGNAVAYGLSYEAALRAITLTPAEMLGLDSELGSIDKGKRANLVLAEGDIFEPSTRIVHVFIDGRDLSLDTVQTRNYEKYRPRPLKENSR